MTKTPKSDEATIDALINAGVELVANIPTPWGGTTTVLKKLDVVAFLTDREDWFARKNGVTKEDYLAWLEAEGLPRCGATTRNGGRCRNPVSGGTQRNLLDWLNEDAGFCTVHGGASSDEAAIKRWGRKK